jgi:hypothetical protein
MFAWGLLNGSQARKNESARPNILKFDMYGNPVLTFCANVLALTFQQVHPVKR